MSQHITSQHHELITAALLQVQQDSNRHADKIAAARSEAARARRIEMRMLADLLAMLPASDAREAA